MDKNLFSLFRTAVADRLKINIFSKHLQFLNYYDLAEAAAEMGFDGIDLTVRPSVLVSSYSTLWGLKDGFGKT
jgi:L-ribulose-5-phosphate 3-epimerase